MTKVEALIKYEETIRNALRQAVKDTFGKRNCWESLWISERGEIIRNPKTTGNSRDSGELYRIAVIHGRNTSDYEFQEAYIEAGTDGVSVDVLCQYYMEEYDDKKEYEKILEKAEMTMQAEEQMRLLDELLWCDDDDNYDD